MSEFRRPVEIWSRRLPENEGKKPSGFYSKIEIFPSHYWARHWEPGSDLFHPKMPLQSEARKEAWETRFRIRVNGKWVGEQAKYETYTKQQIFDRYFA